MALQDDVMSQNPTPDVAAEVRAELGRQSRDNAWLAGQLGVSEMWVGRRLRGKTRFTVEDLHRCADALGIAASDLLQPPVRAA